jgi:hypothetical protein
MSATTVKMMRLESEAAASSSGLGFNFLGGSADVGYKYWVFFMTLEILA